MLLNEFPHGVVMSGTIVKKIGGKKYVYFEYYEDGATRQKYCGPEGSDQGKLKALTFEYEHVKAKRDALNERLSKIEKGMDQMKRTKKSLEHAGDEGVGKFR